MASAMPTLRVGARRCSKLYRSSRSCQQFSTSLTRSRKGEAVDVFTKIEQKALQNKLEPQSSHIDLPRPGEELSHRPTLHSGPYPIRQLHGGKFKAGFFNMGEKPGEMEDDPELEMNDISSLAHGDLELHREYREYARLAAWEMPLLTKMAKDFKPPTSKQVLRFRYTTYMGEEHHGEKKVVVEFNPSDMPNLTDVQRMKLKKLVGVRYNPEKDIIKMSSEMFETSAQNKRYLGDLVDTLLREARDPRDTFEDIPLDTRHHPIKVKPRFPVAWRNPQGKDAGRISPPARQAEIEAYRQESLRLDAQKMAEDKIVDGVKLIEAALKKPGRIREVVPEMVMAAGGKGKGGKRLSVRR